VVTGVLGAPVAWPDGPLPGRLSRPGGTRPWWRLSPGGARGVPRGSMCGCAR